MDAAAREALRVMGWWYFEPPAQKRPRFERLEYPDGNRRAIVRHRWYVREKQGRWLLQRRREDRSVDSWQARKLDYVKTFDTAIAAATFFALHNGR